MATATLTRCDVLWMQERTVSSATATNDWAWNLGLWTDTYGVGSDASYAAVCVEYTVPTISGAITNATLSIPCTFDANSNSSTDKMKAVLSTFAPPMGVVNEKGDIGYVDLNSWRWGPSSGLISNVVAFAHSDKTLTFNLKDGAAISGKKVYLYLYCEQRSTIFSFVAYAPDNGVLTYSSAEYLLSISADSGCTVTVDRISSSTGSLGILNNGDTLYHGDKLKISFSPKNNYTIITHTVNGTSHSSGGTRTVTSDISIIVTSQTQQTDISDASNVTLGNACLIKWTPLSSSNRYKITFSIGSWSATTSIIHPNQTSLFTYSGYTIPLDAAEALPDSTQGVMTATLYAYSDENATNQISTSTFTFSVSVPSSVVPTISDLNVSIDNSAYPSISSWGIAIAGYSKAKLTASANGAYGSSIVSFTISGGYSTTQSGDSLDYSGSVMTSSGSKTFTVTCKDSRGRISKAVTTGAITFYKYTPPEITNFLIDRGTNSVTIKVDWAYSSLSGKNTATAKLMYKLNSDSTWLTYSGEVKKNQSFTPSLSLSDPKKYDFKIIVTDALSSSDQSNGTSQEGNTDVLLDFKSDGAGLGVGRECLTNALEIGLTTKFYGSIEINGIALENYIRSLITSVLEQNGLISNTDG